VVKVDFIILKTIHYKCINEFYAHVSDAEDKLLGFRKALCSGHRYRALLPPNQHCFCLDIWWSLWRWCGFLRTESDEKCHIVTRTVYSHWAVVTIKFFS